MKSPIDNENYDITMAKLLGSYTNGKSPLDHDCIAERLYLKGYGEYFLYAFGGAWTQYGHVYRSGECRARFKIIPLTAEEAESWLVKRLNTTDY